MRRRFAGGGGRDDFCFGGGRERRRMSSLSEGISGSSPGHSSVTSAMRGFFSSSKEVDGDVVTCDPTRRLGGYHRPSPTSLVQRCCPSFSMTNSKGRSSCAPPMLSRSARHSSRPDTFVDEGHAAPHGTQSSTDRSHRHTFTLRRTDSPQTRPSTTELLNNAIPPYLSLPRFLSANGALLPLLQRIPYALSQRYQHRTETRGKEDALVSKNYGRMLMRPAPRMRVCRWGIRVLHRVCRGRGSSCRRALLAMGLMDGKVERIRWWWLMSWLWLILRHSLRVLDHRLKYFKIITLLFLYFLAWASCPSQHSRPNAPPGDHRYPSLLRKKRNPHRQKRRRKQHNHHRQRKKDNVWDSTWRYARPRMQDGACFFVRLPRLYEKVRIPPLPPVTSADFWNRDNHPRNDTDVSGAFNRDDRRVLFALFLGYT